MTRAEKKLLLHFLDELRSYQSAAGSNDIARAEKKLLLHFLDELKSHQSAAGSNDMDESVWQKFGVNELASLAIGFTNWSQEHKTDYVSGNLFDTVQDFEWLEFIKSRVISSVSIGKKKKNEP